MPSVYLRRNFKPNTYHHIFNRGSFQQKIFRKEKDYTVFTDILRYYLLYPELAPLSKLSDQKTKKFKENKTPQPYFLIAYCLMPNHFHLLLKQIEVAPTLSDFLKKISITYAMYFQHQYRHSGALFQGKFKSVQVLPDESLLYVSKYIHLNPQSLKMEGSDPSIYRHSSLKDYLEINNKSWLHPEIIFQNYFANSKEPDKEYKKYLFSPIENAREILLRKMEGSDPSIT